MKKILLTLVLGFSFSSISKAAVQAPRDQAGQVLQSIDWVGAIPCGIDSSTGTNGVLCGSAGRGVVYGVIISSVATTDFIAFRDTNTINTSSVINATVFGSGTDSVASGVATTQVFKFPVPLKFTNAICVTASSAPGSARSRWTILYRPLAATE